MSNVNRLAAMEVRMTLMKGGRHPGAKKAFDEFYLQYGFAGIETMHDAGYDTPEKVYGFYNDICNRHVDEMARRLNLL